MGERIRTICSHLAGYGQPQVHFEPNSGLVSTDTESFSCTLENNKLSKTQRKFYEDNGFLVIKRLVPPVELEKYRNQFEKICKKEVRVPRLTVMRDVAIAKSEFVPGEKAITKIQDFQMDEVLFSYCRLPQILDYVECFLGPNVVSMHTMLINKPPDPGKKSSRHPMHQDLHYFPFRPADRVVCSWTAMEPVHRRNGCLVVIPGSHKRELLKHEYPNWEGGVNKLYYGIQGYDSSQSRVHLEMGPGDTVFFHPLLIHGSGMNRTEGFRKSISCHYCSGDCYLIDVTGTTQEMFQDELNELARQKFKLDKDTVIPLEALWKQKGRLIKGRARVLEG